ncbi:hypothetical protein CHLRE_04g214100v5 [Chlamydomonas reinhardtii]|uniref:Sirohydrochlorin cobaltochelatase n=1 Tax=Chlamydomonas reinhardtii TaxID=3055 RepID=A0A2K3DTU4_CHLRE|nr:uncharacterized protein CHLRE_04g214100v5 [Chlamydomonas reinhardtii]PNW83959.1 hypothetical protein CHLRE_04g214100v5 [Chlamydomonas reinhardtii]
MASPAADLAPGSTSYPAAWPCIRSPRLSRSAIVAAASGNGAGAPGKVGVVIVDHGSRKRASNDMLHEFGALYGQLTGHDLVEVAHMEIAEPTIAQAVGRCAERGASTVVIAPYFLSRGRHIQEDIPALVREAQAEHPGLKCIIADPIGIDPLMVQLISNRVASALEGGDEAGKAAVAVASGAGAGAGQA